MEICDPVVSRDDDAVGDHEDRVQGTVDDGDGGDGHVETEVVAGSGSVEDSLASSGPWDFAWWHMLYMMQTFWSMVLEYWITQALSVILLK